MEQNCPPNTNYISQHEENGSRGRPPSRALHPQRHVPFSAAECNVIQKELDRPLEPEHITYRPSGQGQVAYLEGWKSLQLANEVFGFNGWSSEILSLTTDFLDTDSTGRVSLGMSCMVRVHLRDGTFHDVRIIQASIDVIGYWLWFCRESKKQGGCI